MRERADDSSEILDLAILAEATAGDHDLARELAVLYVADGDARLPLLEAAAAAQDLVCVSQVAHGLKGASLSMGAARAAAAFQRLETLGRGRDPAGLADAVDEARSAYLRTRERMRELAA